MKKFLLPFLLLGTFCFANDETPTLSLGELIPRSTAFLQSADMEEEDELKDSLNQILHDLISPVFEENGQALSGHIDAVEVVDDHLGKCTFHCDLTTDQHTLSLFVDHAHPILFPESPDTTIHTQLSPLNIKAKVGKHVIDKKLIHYVLLAGMMDLGIPKDAIQLQVIKWELNDSLLREAKLILNLDLRGVGVEHFSLFDQLKIDFSYQRETLRTEVEASFNPERYLEEIEPITDLLVEDFYQMQQGEEATLDGLKSIAELLSSLFVEVEGLIKK